LEEEGKTVITMIVDGVPQLIISLEESELAKPEAQQVVAYFQKQMGMRVCMITGDNMHSAFKVADHLNIKRENVTYQAYPDTKRNVVMKLQEEGRKVMFVGDGINDGPVLAQANVGCAINSASDITVGAAGIVLMKDSLEDVVLSVLIALKSYQRIKINFFYAFLYNTILIPVAMGAFYPINHFKLDPMYAALAMASSSISVVTSSLLLRMYNPVH
jgi:Cu+-exporting ATPase